MDRESRHQVVESESSSQKLDGEQGKIKGARKEAKHKGAVSRADKRQKKADVDVREVLAAAKHLQKRMQSILEKDNGNNLAGKPAVEKIQHVDDVSNMLMNRALQECLLDEGILNEIKGWLEPLPDRSMPNPKVKKRLLDALKNMRIRKEHLLSSGVGKIVYFYSINHQETKDIRAMAKQLVQKWTNEVFKQEEEY